jgi:hypothetical protein
MHDDQLGPLCKRFLALLFTDVILVDSDIMCYGYEGMPSIKTLQNFLTEHILRFLIYFSLCWFHFAPCNYM